MWKTLIDEAQSNTQLSSPAVSRYVLLTAIDASRAVGNSCHSISPWWSSAAKRPGRGRWQVHRFSNRRLQVALATTRHGCATKQQLCAECTPHVRCFAHLFEQAAICVKPIAGVEIVGMRDHQRHTAQWSDIRELFLPMRPSRSPSATNSV